MLPKFRIVWMLWIIVPILVKMSSLTLNRWYYGNVCTYKRVFLQQWILLCRTTVLSPLSNNMHDFYCSIAHSDTFYHPPLYGKTISTGQEPLQPSCKQHFLKHQDKCFKCLTQYSSIYGQCKYMHRCYMRCGVWMLFLNVACFPSK